MELQRLTTSIAKELWSFEMENREYFEQSVPSRGDAYYHYDTFCATLQELMQEWEDGLSYMYIIRDNGQIIGRINLIVQQDEASAELGYRIGAAFAGKGCAKQALQQLLQEAKKHQIRIITASTTAFNKASQAVLLKNGFQLVSIQPAFLEWNGQKEDFLTFRYDADES